MKVYPDSFCGIFPRPTRRGPIEAVYRIPNVATAPGFPRPTRRGPIEACHMKIIYVALGNFPRPTRRGPIEALDRENSPPTYRYFPRPTRRGSIEAVTTTDPTTGETSFRVPQDAAPLKPDRLVAVEALDPHFPRPTRRGPIEAFLVCPIARLLAFSASHKTRPH